MHVPEPIVGGRDPSSRRCSPTRSGSRCWSCSRRSSPAERLAFVLHDMFAVPFDQIAPIVDRSPAAARQLASRARRRVRGAVPEPDADLTAQRAVVDAFLAAAREGDFEALLAVLDPGRRAPRRPRRALARDPRRARPSPARRSRSRGSLRSRARGGQRRPGFVVDATAGACARSRASRSPADGSPRSTSSPTPTRLANRV